MTKLRKEDYTIAWICALASTEWKASRLLLDEEHDDVTLSHPNRHQYVYGTMNQHNVVMGCLPATQLGIGAAASVASAMLATFPSIKFGLMVGVGGGVPSEKRDVRLGDIVVSQPNMKARDGGVVQYDFGKTLQNRRLEHVGALHQTSPTLMSALSKGQSANTSSSKFHSYIDSLCGDEDSKGFWDRPLTDKLFRAEFTHVPGRSTCKKCDSKQEVKRVVRNSNRPVVHYGTIASGDRVMKDAKTRDEISKRHANVLCFEMEAAGLVTQLPCLTIRGICDYSDSHKNDDWQPFAAAAAAAWAKQLLSNISPAEILTRQANLKSQFEYSHRFRELNPEHWVFWVHASTKARFVQTYEEIAKVAEVPGYQDPQANRLELVKDWLKDSRNGHWLLILDNADDPEMFFSQRRMSENEGNTQALSTYFPQCSHGSILVTSRNDTGRELAGSHQFVEVVDQFHTETAKTLLGKHQPQISNDEDAVKLVEDLDRIPLAITQAAAYMSKARITIARYLEVFNQSERDQQNLLDRKWNDIRGNSGISNTVLTTWRVSFEQIRRSSTLAIQVLSLMSMFDRQGIPETLISVEASDFELGEATGLLLEYSLISRETNGTFYSMHRLVQTATRTWLDINQELVTWQERSLAVLSEKFPDGSLESWDTCETLLPHAERVVSYDHWSGIGPDTITLLQKMGMYLRMRGADNKALSMFDRTLAEQEKQLGVQHPDTLATMRNRGEIYLWQGRYEKAETQFRRAIKGREKQLEAEDLDTLLLLKGLSNVYWSQGRYENAQILCERVLECIEKQRGLEHPATISVMQNLATIYLSQGRFSEAETLLRWGLEACERQLGPDVPETALLVQRLAIVCVDQGRLEEAETLCKRALNALKTHLGPEHPDTFSAVACLAHITCNQERHAEAELLYRTALKESEKRRGPEHPQTLIIIHGLATVIWSQGRYKEAEALSARAVNGCKKLGPEHPHTLLATDGLANAYQSQGRYHEAEVLYMQTLKGREKVLGPDHPNTLFTVGGLASVYHRQHRYEVAEVHFKRALKARETLGPEHPNMLLAMYGLASVYHSQARYGEAKALYEQVLKGRERQLGRDHPETLRTAQSLASLQRPKRSSRLSSLRLLCQQSKLTRRQQRAGKSQTAKEKS